MPLLLVITYENLFWEVWLINNNIPFIAVICNSIVIKFYSQKILKSRFKVSVNKYKLTTL